MAEAGAMLGVTERTFHHSFLVEQIVLDHIVLKSLQEALSEEMIKIDIEKPLRNIRLASCPTLDGALSTDNHDEGRPALLIHFSSRSHLIHPTNGGYLTSLGGYRVRLELESVARPAVVPQSNRSELTIGCSGNDTERLSYLVTEA